MTLLCILGQPEELFLSGSITDAATPSSALHLPAGLPFSLQTRDLLPACDLAPVFCANLSTVPQTFFQSQELSWTELSLRLPWLLDRSPAQDCSPSDRKGLRRDHSVHLRSYLWECLHCL